ncbi:MAG: hypothetical protein HUN04_02760 [Desulfobacter sp.]|nr:MAG: hypothetical protein HUN04_02760 [Desulfobacter sp.]
MKLNGYAGWGTGVLIVVEGKKYLSLIKKEVFMGGPGSGRFFRFNTKPTVERQIYIDIRLLKRQNALPPGTAGKLSWSSNGNKRGAVHFEVQENCLTLKYRYRGRGGAWEGVKQVIFFDQTPCNYGGYRKWFLCSQCERKVEILYSLGGAGKNFLCRDCHGLTYASCNTHSTKRLFNRANKLKRKIGAEPGIMDIIPEKPKGMHRSTFDNILDKIQRLEYLGDQAIVKKWAKLNKFHQY